MGRGLKIKMYDFLIYIIQAIEIVLFVKGIVRLEYHKNKGKLLVGALVLILGETIYAFCPDENIGMIVGMILLQTMGTVMLFEARVSEGIGKYCFSSAYVSVLHMPFDVLYVILSETINVNLNNDIKELLFSAVVIVLIIGISKYIGKHSNMVMCIKEIPTGYFFLAYMCGTATVGISASIRYVAPEVNQGIRILLNVLNCIVSMFLYAVGIGFALASLWCKQYQRESELKDEYIIKTKEYYQVLTEHMKEIRSIRHDMNSHLNIIDKYTETGELDKLKSYIGKIRKQSQYVSSPIVNVGNSIVSAVLTDTMRKVGIDEKISLIHEGTLPERLLISDYDLCIIFSNLMSNCVEACRRLNESERRIHMKLSIDRNSLSVICENPIEWKVDLEQLNNNGYTSKKDKVRHGYGVTNIRRVVSAYDSDMKMYVKEGMFVTKIVFYKAVS